MSQPAIQNLTMKTGDRWDFVVNVVDGNGDAYDLAGTTVWLTVKETLLDEDPGVLQVSTSDAEVTVTDAAAGEVTFALGSDRTTLQSGRYVYDVQIQKAAWAGPKTTQQGSLLVTGQVTRAAI